MTCTFPRFDRGARGALRQATEGRNDSTSAHVLLVKIPPRTARGRRWALANGIGEVDVATLTAMLRAERLSAG